MRQTQRHCIIKSNNEMCKVDTLVVWIDVVFFLCSQLLDLTLRHPEALNA